MHNRSAAVRAHSGPGGVEPELPVRAVPGREARASSRPGISVLVDARGLLTSGIGRYLREILPAVFADPRVGRVTLLGEVGSLREFFGSVPHGEKGVALSYPYGFYSPAAQAGWLGLRLWGAARADVSFFPHYDVPAVALPERSVVTVHDLIHFKVPELFPAWRRAGAGVLLRRGVAGATRVIAVSEATRRDLAERFPFAAPKTEVVPNGVSACFMEARGAGADPLPGAVAEPYLLCVGNRKPHKNLRAAVDALAQLRGERPGLRLVIVGTVYPGWDSVLAHAGRLGVRDRVVELSDVSDAGLRALYARCEALLFPSLYEGFGLPVLEAMACGTPVVASDRSSIPEVVGDGGILVDPEIPGAMAEGVRRLWREPGLRDELARRARARAAAFSWQESARRTVEILCRVAGRVDAARP